MVDLGKKAMGLYDAPSSPKEEKKYYPSVTLPLSILNGQKYSVGDVVSLDLKGKIVSMTSDEYGEDCRIELQEGEAATEEKQGE